MKEVKVLKPFTELGKTYTKGETHEVNLNHAWAKRHLKAGHLEIIKATPPPRTETDKKKG